ncbi:DUF3455 domain-containing protein [Lichenicoccus sp.]|uniref:DUF3455 domain-containing protein n=1 Tax=Lichenicoccus sp. TaxID=2781899 RepID=UPI003D0B39B3
MSNSRVVVLGVSAALAAIAVGARAAGVIELRARGVQVYVCKAARTGFAWSLTGPDATLSTAAGIPAGRHFAGPAWQATDGSIVVGEVVASGSAEGAVPWLVLRATSHSGAGRFAGVTYVTRTSTSGGLPPSGGCDATHAGSSTRVPYRATYSFFAAPPAAKP